MKIALAQLNYIIGAFDLNTKAIINAVRKAREQKADLIVFSELSVCGYPPLDLLEHKYFIEKCEKAVQVIATETENIGAIIGAPRINDHNKGKNLFNAAFFLYNKSVFKITDKSLLPTYDIFDEYRYFESGANTSLIEFKGYKIALTICEDLWYNQPLLTNFGKNKMYTVNPMKKLVEQQPDFIINIAGSPFSYPQEDIKHQILINTAKLYQLPVFYVNQVGAQTELIFDGGSRVVNSLGYTIHQMDFFKEEVRYFDVEEILKNNQTTTVRKERNIIEEIHDALVLGIRDYFSKMNFKKAVIGLSGGIDSAVTCVLTVRALGKENVRVLLLPSKYSSDHSVTDALKLTEKMGIQHDIIGIKDIAENFEKVLQPVFKKLSPDVAEENIQARIRGTLLMAISNKFNTILLNTSNKSEVAVGYGTLYGDMNGGLSVLGDVYKTDVYKLAKFINRIEEVIPENTIKKPPSAELRPDQKDTDSLPEYDLLDDVLYHYVELKQSAEDIIQSGIDQGVVDKVIRMVNANEYKRFQTPPILRVSSKAFGFGRRMPLVARY
ncbi:MAG: NAD+ synthase [Bacteroidales bacterium]|nr:NAD+ synthase [Bacteroidales bacterium]